MAAYVTNLFTTLCKNCDDVIEHHAGDNCLWAPTKFESMMCEVCNTACTAGSPGFDVLVDGIVYYMCLLCDWSTDYPALGYTNYSDYLTDLLRRRAKCP